MQSVFHINSFVVVLPSSRVFTMALSTLKTTKEKKVHWATRASGVLRNFEAFLQAKGLSDEYEKFAIGSASAGSSQQGGDQQGGGDGGGDGGSGDSDGSGDENPSGDDFDPEDYSSDDEGDGKHIQIYVDTRALGRKWSHVHVSFWVRPSWAVRSIKMAIYGKFGVSPDFFRLIRAGGATIYEQRSFIENSILGGSTLLLQIGGRGGGRRVITKHLKEDEARRNLTQKTIVSIKNYMETFETRSDTPPPSIQNVITPIQSKLLDIKRQLGEGQDVLLSALETLDDSKLKMLSEIYATKQGKFTSEKLLKSAYCVLPELNDIDEYVAHLTKTKHQIVEAYVEAYTTSFMKNKDGEMVCDNAGFTKNLDNLISYRQRLRRDAESANNANGQERGHGNPNNNCVLM